MMNGNEKISEIMLEIWKKYKKKKKKKIWVKENITAQSRVNPKTNLFLSFLLCSFKCQIMKTRNL